MKSKKKIFIHIGNHKTGTSSLQFFLSKKKNFLYKNKILYLIDKNSTNHHNISWQAIGHFYYNSKKQNITDLLEEISNKKNYNVLISSENFENLKFSKEFKNFIKQIKKTHKLKIIWSIRNQFSYLVSLLTTLINKGAYINNFDILVSNILKRGKLSFKPYVFWFDYMSQYRQICKVFNITKKDIFLLLYSKDCNIFQDFCTNLSIKIKINSLSNKKNVSKYFFDNKKNIKNMIKNLLNYNKSYFTKNIVDNKSVTKKNKNKYFFSKKEILKYRKKILDFYKLNNEDIMKIFKKNSFEIKKFYNEY